MIPFWKRWVSYLIPFVLERAKGELHEELRLVLTRGHLEVEGDDANYSYGTNHIAWRSVLRETQALWEKARDCLILGFGCGTIASLIDHSQRRVVGVEREKVLLTWFQNYFQSSLQGHYEIVLMDVNEFLQKENQKYDAIFVDLFIGTRVPKDFLSLSFIQQLKRLLSFNGIILMNFIETHLDQRNFANTLKSEAGGVLMPYYPNLFWIYQQKATNSNFVP